MKLGFMIICYMVAFIYSAHSWASGVRIIDADTIELNTTKVRLNGIDAPEMRQMCEGANSKKYSCGIAARDALQSLILKMPDEIIECQYTDKDLHDRLLGDCSIGKININMWLVEKGWALAYRKYSKKYVKNENIAKSNNLGVWRGKFVKPWNWRRGKRLDFENSKSNNGCLIKGNISSRGERIYHVENGYYYTRTKISLEKGERWFCSAKEAEENGWRKSKR